MQKCKEHEKLTSEAMKAYKAKAKTPDPNRPIQTTPPAIPQLELSLIHDVIRGNVKGSLGKSVDAKLGLSKDTSGTKYMHLMVRNVGEMTIQNRESKDKATRKAKRKLCKSEGCGKFSWNGGGGFCYVHTELSKRLCCQCKTRTKKYAGGLCRPCKVCKVRTIKDKSGTSFCPGCRV